MTIRKYGRYWALYDDAGTLVCGKRSQGYQRAQPSLQWSVKPTVPTSR